MTRLDDLVNKALKPVVASLSLVCLTGCSSEKTQDNTLPPQYNQQFRNGSSSGYYYEPHNTTGADYNIAKYKYDPNIYEELYKAPIRADTTLNQPHNN